MERVQVLAYCVYIYDQFQMGKLQEYHHTRIGLALVLGSNAAAHQLLEVNFPANKASAGNC